MLDVLVAQTTLENAVRDAVLYALGKRLPVFGSVAALRAFATRGAARDDGSTGSTMDDDDLACVQTMGVASYRWSSTDTDADDGAATIKPDDVTGAGRWKRWTSAMRLRLAPGGDSYALSDLTTGPLKRVIVLDKSVTPEEMVNLVAGQTPAVLIEATGDDDEDMTTNSGHKWDARYHFTLYVISENLRERREAAQGDETSDPDPGANALDGSIMSLLAGTGLYSMCDAVRVCRARSGRNWQSQLLQRLVFRSREYEVIATVENPAAPNDAGPMEEFDVQRQAASSPEDAPTRDDYVASGILINFSSLGVGFTKTIQAGTAYIGGALVTYAGGSHTFSASKDTYRDLNPDGTLTFVEAENGQDEPAVTTGALRVGVTITDASGATDDRYLCTVLTDYDAVIQVPLT